MALAILDGNQSATTLSTIVVSSAHIPAHTVVSLGTQAITDISTAFVTGQGATTTTSNFTSTSPSTSLASASATRKVLSVFNEGGGLLYIAPLSTCTTISYQVRLSIGDYYEAPIGQVNLAHTAVFASAGTARVVLVD